MLIPAIEGIMIIKRVIKIISKANSGLDVKFEDFFTKIVILAVDLSPSLSVTINDTI